MTDKQIEQVCSAIQDMFSFHRADAFEHLFGPRDDPAGLAYGIHRIANALELIAERIAERNEEE